jgi:hypothetical protein
MGTCERLVKTCPSSVSVDLVPPIQSPPARAGTYPSAPTSKGSVKGRQIRRVLITIDGENE